MAKTVYVVYVKVFSDFENIELVFSYLDRDKAYSEAEAWGKHSIVTEVLINTEA